MMMIFYLFKKKINLDYIDYILKKYLFNYLFFLKNV
jgi:hypothetical protein